MSHTLVALVVVPYEGKYPVVQERDGSFFLPAGRVEPGEDLVTAALRETAEEAGLAIGLKRLLDHSPWKVRFTFVGSPTLPLRAPKSKPDDHSRGAGWFTKAEITRSPLRHPEVLSWIDRYEREA